MIKDTKNEVTEIVETAECQNDIWCWSPATQRLAIKASSFKAGGCPLETEKLDLSNKNKSQQTTNH